VPPPDGAHAVGASLSRLRRPSHRAHRAPTTTAKSEATKPTTEYQAQRPYHPHIQHERVDTTQIYLHADLALKERALARTKPPDAKPGRYRPPDTLLAFLEAL
jgi:hypothetical protein